MGRPTATARAEPVDGASFAAEGGANHGMAKLEPGDLVVDIGSNDSTLLQAYPDSLTLVGVDPSGPKFKQYYPAHIRLIPDFFSADLVKRAYPGRRAKVISSIAMFYDLERPQAFVDEIAACWTTRACGCSSRVICLSCSRAIPTIRCATTPRVLRPETDQAHDRPGGAQDRRYRVQRHQWRQFFSNGGQEGGALSRGGNSNRANTGGGKRACDRQYRNLFKICSPHHRSPQQFIVFAARPQKPGEESVGLRRFDQRQRADPVLRPQRRSHSVHSGSQP